MVSNQKAVFSWGALLAVQKQESKVAVWEKVSNSFQLGAALNVKYVGSHYCAMGVNSEGSIVLVGGQVGGASKQRGALEEKSDVNERRQ